MLAKTFSVAIALLASSEAFAQAVECQSFNAPQDKGVYGGANEVIATRSNVSPAMGDDFVIAGGRCAYTVYNGQGVSSPQFPFNIYWERPIDNGSGFSCKAGSDGLNIYVTTTATLFACRVAQPYADPKRMASFSTYGLGGDAVAIAKAVDGAVPYSIRVCNRTPKQDISVDLGASVRKLTTGQCLEIDKPPQAFVRAVMQVTTKGVYALFKPGTFPATPHVGPPTVVDNSARVQPGAFKSMTATCAKPAPGDPPVNAAYWGLCPMTELKGGKNYRVCFDDGYSNQGDGLEWYGGGLRVVTDSALMNKPPQGGQLSPYDYMSAAPGGCRDMFGVKNAWLLPADNMNNWNNQSVSLVTYRYAEIPAP